MATRRKRSISSRRPHGPMRARGSGSRRRADPGVFGVGRLPTFRRRENPPSSAGPATTRWPRWRLASSPTAPRRGGAEVTFRESARAGSGARGASARVEREGPAAPPPDAAPRLRREDRLAVGVPHRTMPSGPLPSTFAHIYPVPQYAVSPFVPPEVGNGPRPPTGPGLCRILHPDFGERPFHALG